MELSESQKKFLRGLGHQLKPVIMIGDAGLATSSAGTATLFVIFGAVAFVLAGFASFGWNGVLDILLRRKHHEDEQPAPA